MPHTVRKRGTRYAIVKQLPGGKTRTIGHSTSKRKAKASARIRDQASRGR